MVHDGSLGVAVVPGRLPAKPVDRPVPGGGEDPATGVRGHPGCRPPLQRDDEGLLDRLLGDVDVTEEADQGRDRSS